MRNSHFRHRVIKQYSLGLLVEENVGWWMTGADNVLMTTMHQTFFTSACGFHPRVGKIPLEEVSSVYICVCVYMHTGMCEWFCKQLLDMKVQKKQ